MADPLLEAGVGEVVSQLTTAIIYVTKKTSQFKPKLIKLQETINRNKPIFDEIDKLLENLDRPKAEKEMFISQLKEAEALVRKCERIKWNYHKMFTHSLKLDDLNASLLRFCQIDLQLLVTKGMLDLQLTKEGCRFLSVPLPEVDDVIGFQDQVRYLKAMVLKDSGVDNCSVVVVSAAGGCGKTTLVTMLCHHPEIQSKFGENIYFATISETPNLKNVINNLLPKNHDGQKLDFTNDEDAIKTWRSFLGGNKSDILLVLDDVWSDDIVKSFMCKLRGYKILVTSRSTFKKFDDTYHLELLNHKDATKLFNQSAFSDNGSKRTDIPVDLVDKLVKCCKNHPLTLSVIGGMLKGTNTAKWIGMLKNLSEGKQSVLDLDDPVLRCLARSLNVFEEESVIKQCYLDLGLFPEDQKIAATLLMDMWVHLYNHDEEGLDTINQLFELSYKNLANLLPIRENSPMIANWCEEKTVMQHDLMRMLAIHLSNKGPVENRKRLIINANGKKLLPLPKTVNARLLSIYTDKIFSSTWDDMKFPEVEVFVFNFVSTKYDLPQFIQNMEKLKVLIITNYGYSFSQLQNFPAPQYLSGLTRIRLDHVSISLISTSLLELKNLQKLSLMMCKIGKSFNEQTVEIPNMLPSLVEMDIESCDDLLTFPAMLCNLVLLRKLSIINCHELTSLSEELGNLSNLEVLRLASCSKLPMLPESLKDIHKLNVIDLSHCLSLCKFPVDIGELGSLQTIYMSGCTGLHDLPKSVGDLNSLKVVCDEEISKLWKYVTNVEVEVIEEDRRDTLWKMIGRGYIYEC